MDFTKLDLQRIRSIISYKGVTLRASYARCKCMGVLYYKLAAFIINTKDV
ncbi:SsrA-binding protein [Helicobacter pylori]|nr:SsrA-binding protein [Helicobacter pylori]